VTHGLRLDVSGAVQGVGFRPAVHRLAREHGLAGFVANHPGGARIEVGGPPEGLERFQAALRSLPPPVRVRDVQPRPITPAPATDFHIRESFGSEQHRWSLRADLAPCADCRRELADPRDRRFGYPFLSCPACGPSASIANALPWDRARTEMRAFPMCAACDAEYATPEDRRFHGELTTCAGCGPRLRLLDPAGDDLGASDVIGAAAGALARGAVIALKGVGGFQLICDADHDEAVARVRAAKARPRKPLAVMVLDVDSARPLAHLDDDEAALLRSPEAPIVLLEKRPSPLAERAAPGVPDLGVLLPASPLHLLLARAAGRPLVVTSANVDGAPMALDPDELGALDLDLILDHDRPIARRLDDSLARVVRGRPQLLRRARGYAPGIVARTATGPTVIGVGAHLKSAVAVAVGRDVILGPHVGDLDTASARDACCASALDLCALTGARPTLAARDLHPDAGAREVAAALALPEARAPHHRAHVLACLAEHGDDRPSLAAAWDGLGLGEDGDLWGGELFDTETGERVLHLAPFPLPGGEAAIREPRRQALGLRFANDLVEDERDPLLRLLERGVNAPLTTSAGRYFDAVCALVGAAPETAYEGEAAMILERLARRGWPAPPFPVALQGTVAHIDISAIVESTRADAPENTAARFHATLVELLALAAARAGRPRVLLTGGCFQNRLLLEEASARLERDGFEVRWPERIPPGDGGLSVGQVLWAREVA
jgi:hydrogenase maturation protein HypF